MIESLRIKVESPFALLRSEMRRYDVTQRDIASELGKCVVYVNERLTAKKPWTLDDIWNLLRYFHISADDMSRYFPKGGFPNE